MIVKKESNFNVFAINYNTDDEGIVTSIDRGLFQLNNGSFPDLLEEDFYNIKINIYNGINYLKHCLDTFDSYSQAISAYNGGSKRVIANELAYEKATYDYVSDVIDYYAQLDKEFYMHYRIRVNNI